MGMSTDSKALFEILIRENAAMLRIYLRSAIRDRATVEDIFQETSLVAWQTLDRFDRARPFGPWLRGIASKLVLAHYRKHADKMVLCNETMLEELDTRITSLSQRSGDTFDEKLNCLRKCMAELPELLREAIRQRYFLLLSRQEMAERLGATDEAVKKRLQRARTQLLDCVLRGLAEEGDRS
jgi:RNA polymerase sigma-70 factor